jgi:phosphatidate cytidylyltransferase
LKLRLLTALVGIPVVLGAVFCTKHWPFLLVLAIVIGLALYELNGLFPAFKNGWTRFFAVLVALIVSYYSVLEPQRLFSMSFAFILGILFAWSLQRRRGFLNFALASLWIAIPVFSLWLLWFGSFNGDVTWNFSNRLLMVLFPLWAGDSAGIFVGKYCGKHLLAPSISPKKTWEGAIANFCACTVLALATGYFLELSTLQSLACGIICGTLGQVGDLFESSLKRSAGVKDSGNILPGHGGILDRIDSVLLSAPFVFIALTSLA